MKSYWSWFGGGIALACCFLLAVTLVKPIGVSTQFVIVDGIVWSFFDQSVAQPDPKAKRGVSSANAYLNKSDGKYAAAVATPLSYGLVFVFAMVAGAFIARRTGNSDSAPMSTDAGPDGGAVQSGRQRYLLAFLGGVLVLYGARLAGGCTSGHMMSGMMQTSLSGYLFTMAAFAAGVPVAIWRYGRKS